MGCAYSKLQIIYGWKNLPIQSKGLVISQYKKEENVSYFMIIFEPLEDRIGIIEHVSSILKINQHWFFTMVLYTRFLFYCEVGIYFRILPYSYTIFAAFIFENHKAYHFIFGYNWLHVSMIHKLKDMKFWYWWYRLF